MIFFKQDYDFILLYLHVFEARLVDPLAQDRYIQYKFIVQLRKTIKREFHK